jgi:chitin disaccharide deacetylase
VNRAGGQGRVLIVSADDFGRSEGINAGVLRAHGEGIVTSAGLMVRWPAAEEAAEQARAAGLDLGLHVELGEWTFARGQWEAVHEVVDIERPEDVASEIHRQLEAFRRLTGRDPTHLDSHQHVHLEPPATPVFRRAAAELGVPLRARGIGYTGDFYGQDGYGVPFHDAISVEGLLRIIAKVRTGVSEIGCHPGLGDDADSGYAREREIEVATLCDPRVRAAIEDAGIELRSFAELGRETGSV